MNTLKQVEITLKTNLDKVLSNGVVMGFLKIFLVLYAVRIAPTPPEQLNKVFSNTYFKIFAIALLAYISSVDFQLAIILAIIFVLGLNYMSGRQLLESFKNTPKELYASENAEWNADSSKVTTLLGQPVQLGSKPIESDTNVHPGCVTVTMADLLNVFNGDSTQLRTSVEYAYLELMDKLKSQDAKTRLEKIAIAAGLNHNVPFNDENAPFIATILLNRGYIVTDTCQPPHKEVSNVLTV
jgi:hypothetical protein